MNQPDKNSLIAEGYQKLCDVKELPFSGGKRFILGDHDIAVFNINGELKATGNVCPHQHSAILYDGFIEENSVVCPAHGWKFDLDTGCREGGKRGIDAYPLHIAGSEVFIKLPDSKKGFSLW